MRGFASDAAEPVVGEVFAIRAFELGDDGLLFPLVPGPGPWSGGTNTAACTGQHAHHAPAVDCTCGFYAYFEPGWVYGGAVAAVVSMWGQSIVGTRGLRAQHARIEAVCLPPDVPEQTRAAVVAAYPAISVHRELAAMTEAHRLTPKPGRRRPRLPVPSATALWAVQALLGLVLFGALATLAASSSPAGAWAAWLRGLAAVLAVASVVARSGPVRRWREVLAVGRTGWLGLVVVSFLIVGDGGQRAIGLAVAAAVILGILVTRWRARIRPTPLKPNQATRDWLHAHHSLQWQVGPETVRRGITQVDSHRSGEPGVLRYLAHPTLTRMTPRQRVGTGTRLLTAASPTAAGAPVACIVEALPSTGWVEVSAQRRVGDLDAALSVAEVAAALGLPAPALGRAEFAPQELPPTRGPVADLGAEPGTQTQ